MDSTDLQTFCAVVEHGGVTAAAERLHRVQSSISARLAGLERSLGCALFERVGKRLQLTPEGRHLYARSAPLVRDLAALRREMAAGQAAAALRLGAMESTAAARLPAPLAALRRSHPQLRLALRTGPTGALLAALDEGALDAALVAGPAHATAALHWQPVWREELALIAPRASAADGAAQRTLLTFATGCAYRAVALQWAQAQAPENGLDAVIEIGSYHALIASVAAGMGVGLAPRSVLALAAPESLQALQVQALPPVLAAQTTWLVSRAGSRSGALAALRAHLPAETAL